MSPKRIPMTIAALFCGVFALLPVRGDQAAAQDGAPVINAVFNEIVPGKIDDYLAALKVNGEASVGEPGCREFDFAVSQKDPNRVLIFEVYKDAAALDAHHNSEHFKKYQEATKGMVASREATSLSGVAMNYHK